MLQRLVSNLVSNEVAVFRRRISGIGLLAFTLIMLSLAAAFALLALYLWLSTVMPAWYAALVVALMIVLFSLILWLVGRSLLRRHQSQTRIINDEVRSFMGEFSHATGTQVRKQTVELMVTAAIVGIIIGRLMSK